VHCGPRTGEIVGVLSWNRKSYVPVTLSVLIDSNELEVLEVGFSAPFASDMFLSPVCASEVSGTSRSASRPAPVSRRFPLAVEPGRKWSTFRAVVDEPGVLFLTGYL
jgi:hypothetical protein